MKTLLTLLILTIPLVLPALAQTATTQPQTVPTTAPVIPAGTTLCSVPKNGGPCKTTQAITLPKLSVTVPGATIPVDLTGYTASFTFQIGPGGTFVVNPDGSYTITGAILTLTKAQ